jgi:SAM-dependent methyltransferase
MAGRAVEINRKFYDAFWQKARLQRPQRFNTWPLISKLLPGAAARVELGPGLRPRLPIVGTHFIDVSEPVVERLNAHGGVATLGEIGPLPFGNHELDLVCAFDVIEHLDDDQLVFREVSRTLKTGGSLIFSVPVHANRWTEIDDLVGHVRRYEPADLVAILEHNHLVVERTAAFGLQPANIKWVRYGMWCLEHRRDWAMFWYNCVMMPLATLFQAPIEFVSGFMDVRSVDEILVVCRYAGSGTV